jgi:hypothetical protein
VNGGGTEAAGTGAGTPKAEVAAGAAQPSDAAKTDATPVQDSAPTGAKDDKKKESSSKKKKGLRKVVPW